MSQPHCLPSGSPCVWQLCVFGLSVLSTGRALRGQLPAVVLLPPLGGRLLSQTLLTVSSAESGLMCVPRLSAFIPLGLLFLSGHSFPQTLFSTSPCLLVVSSWFSFLFLSLFSHFLFFLFRREVEKPYGAGETGMGSGVRERREGGNSNALEE